ncbi:hypothetical protein V6238_19270, partial [Marinomonas arenicola]|uniref:hypothetical protein n=1 Tax=Marinomonas arenicola TaxID=569601 RepID=UPI00311E3987
LDRPSRHVGDAFCSSKDARIDLAVKGIVQKSGCFINKNTLFCWLIDRFCDSFKLIGLNGTFSQKRVALNL